MPESTMTEQSTGWKPYKLDHAAQKLVIDRRDLENVLNESHKMRMSVAYGLERFWGEHLRLMRDSKDRDKGEYWKAVWQALHDVLAEAGFSLPNDPVRHGETKKVEAMAEQIWQMPMETQRAALMVLTQLCDSLVWWTQRYKKKNGED